VIEAGEDRLVYSVTAEGIARRAPDGGGPGDFLLRTPITTGATWPISGGTARVIATGKTIEVPAGTFPGCAIVEESRGSPPRIVRTTYAAGVGPVALEVQEHDPARGAFVVTMKARLRGVTRPGEDPFGAPPAR
jgi:hypothetical protein